MRNTKEVAEQNRQKLIDAAIDAFYEAGFNAANLADIAQRAGLTRGAIYGHFEHKADMFKAILEERSIPNFIKVAGLYSQNDDVYELLDSIVDYVLEGPAEVLEGSHRRTQLIQTLFTEVPEGLEEMGRKVEDALEMIFKNHAQVLERAQAAGTVRADIDPYNEARSFYAFVTGYYLTLKRWFDYDPDGEAIRSFFKTKLVDSLRP